MTMGASRLTLPRSHFQATAVEVITAVVAIAHRSKKPSP
jgi:hypothetical protein